ncbi:uncharacterized protein LOC116213804 [Punica granatum]|uniref:Uncharacterized protein n=2 Tax=Punica granatum TaxID=22663 RepID=A0A2I0HK94_PUNGR|nr:uncharacterized protein LOC116213804 [Punica granatum]PKI32013.1 hypothetical protein CRG98_047576 [Punica granatum]
MASSSVITPEDVLESLMNDGTMDALRSKIINQLKANEELKSTAIGMAEESKVLKAPGAEKQSKRELFDALRQELEAPVLEKASKSVWDIILDNDGLGKEINETVERVFCRLSGREPPLQPSDFEGLQDKAIENDKGKGKEKDRSRDHGKKDMLLAPKKRSYVEMSSDGVTEAVKEGYQTSVPESSTITTT